MGRPNWYYEHPPACTCVSCVKKGRRRHYEADRERPTETHRNRHTEQSTAQSSSFNPATGTNKSTTLSSTRNLPKTAELKNLHWLWAIAPVALIVYLLTRPPQLAISNTSVSDITEDMATVTCNTNVDCYCILTLKLPNQVWVKIAEEPQLKNTRHVFKLNDLQSGKNYSVRVYANITKPVIPEEGYYSAESNEISFETKIIRPVISNLRISSKQASWSTNVPTTFIIYNRGEILTRSKEYEYSATRSVSLDLSPYFHHAIVVEVTDRGGLSTKSEPMVIKGELAHRLIPYYSHVSSSGLVELIDNPNAKDPTYQQVVAFLEMDYTDKKMYQQGVFTCGDYAEILHNNAEKAGLRSAFVVLKIHPPQERTYPPYLFSYQQPKQDTTPDTIMHACNAFKTKDLGLAFFDNTGLSERGEPVFTPGRADKKVTVKIGQEYCAENIFKRTATYYKCMGTVLEYTVYWSAEEFVHYSGLD